MKLTIETEHLGEVERLLVLIQELQLENVQINPTLPQKKTDALRKGNKKIDPKDLFGIWAKNPRSLQEIRDTAWKREEQS